MKIVPVVFCTLFFEALQEKNILICSMKNCTSLVQSINKLTLFLFWS
jgi:hypothetical protein